MFLNSTRYLRFVNLSLHRKHVGEEADDVGKHGEVLLRGCSADDKRRLTRGVLVEDVVCGKEPCKMCSTRFMLCSRAPTPIRASIWVIGANPRSDGVARVK